MIVDFILYSIGFLLMVLIQGLIINGVHECFEGSAIRDDLKGETFYQGMIFYMIAPKFFEKVKYQKWFAPIGGCVKCMASLYGALTYFPLVIWLFGWNIIEIPIFISDAFCLSVIAWLIYKKI